jgi:hypothetical protein
MAGMPALARWPFRDGSITVSGPATSDSASGVLELGVRGLKILARFKYGAWEKIRV